MTQFNHRAHVAGLYVVCVLAQVIQVVLQIELIQRLQRYKSMDRILTLQSIQTSANASEDEVASTSTCSFVMCRFCSSTSDSGCGPSNPGDTIVVAV